MPVFYSRNLCPQTYNGLGTGAKIHNGESIVVMGILEIGNHMLSTGRKFRTLGNPKSQTKRI